MPAPQPHPTTVLDYHGDTVEDSSSIHQALIFVYGDIDHHFSGERLEKFHRGQCFQQGKYFIIATKFKNNYIPSMYQEISVQSRLEKRRKVLLKQALNRKRCRVVILDSNLDISEVYTDSVGSLARREGVAYGTMKAYLFRYEEILNWRITSSKKPRKKIFIYRRDYLKWAVIY